MDAHPSHGKVYEVNVLARNDENELPVSKFVRDMALKLHKVTQAIEAPKESHSAQLCALQESQNAQHSELPGNCNSLRVHIARLQWRTTYIERRLMYETVVNASHAILGLLAPDGTPVHGQPEPWLDYLPMSSLIACHAVWCRIFGTSDQDRSNVSKRNFRYM